MANFDYLAGVLDDALDEVGDEDTYLEGDEDDDLGAVRRGRPRRRRGGGGLMRRARAAAPTRGQLLAQRILRGAPGTPIPGERRLPLGFPIAVFTATSGTALTRVTRPQIPISGQRLVVVVARSGATATGLITITDLKIGQRSQLGSADPIPAEAFAPDAVGVALDLDPAQPGIDITVFFQNSLAPTAPDTISVSSMLVNPSVA